MGKCSRAAARPGENFLIKFKTCVRHNHILNFALNLVLSSINYPPTFVIKFIISQESVSVTQRETTRRRWEEKRLLSKVFLIKNALFHMKTTLRTESRQKEEVNYYDMFLWVSYFCTYFFFCSSLFWHWEQLGTTSRPYSTFFSSFPTADAERVFMAKSKFN